MAMWRYPRTTHGFLSDARVRELMRDRDQENAYHLHMVILAEVVLGIFFAMVSLFGFVTLFADPIFLHRHFLGHELFEMMGVIPATVLFRAIKQKFKETYAPRQTYSKCGCGGCDLDPL